MNGQTRLVSFIESATHVTVGFVTAFATWQLVGPMFGYEVSLTQNLGITSIFSTISLLRSYVIRRFFETSLRSLAARLAARLSH